MLMADTGISTGGSSDRSRERIRRLEFAQGKFVLEDLLVVVGKRRLIEAREGGDRVREMVARNLRHWALFDKAAE